MAQMAGNTDASIFFIYNDDDDLHIIWERYDMIQNGEGIKDFHTPYEKQTLRFIISGWPLCREPILCVSGTSHVRRAARLRDVEVRMRRLLIRSVVTGERLALGFSLGLKSQISKADE